MRIHDAINEWWVKTATEVVMFFAAPANEDTAADGFVTTAASSLPTREAMDLVVGVLELVEPDAHMVLATSRSLREGKKMTFETLALSDMQVFLSYIVR